MNLSVIKQYIKGSQWCYNYGTHMNGSLLIEEESFSEIEQRRQTALADVIFQIKGEIQSSIEKITFLEQEISSLRNTISKRNRIDGGYGGETLIMKRTLRRKEAQINTLYTTISGKHSRLINRLECVN